MPVNPVLRKQIYVGAGCLLVVSRRGYRWGATGGLDGVWSGLIIH